MNRSSLGRWLFIALVLVMPAACEPTGPFTGEVKPVLYVADVEASAPFFRDDLGFEFLGFSELDGAPYYAEMAAGGLKFGLHNALNPEHEEWIGHQRIYFRVADVFAHREKVMAGSGEPGEILERDWMDFFIVRDLDGHEIVFAETDPTRHSIDPWATGQETAPPAAGQETVSAQEVTGPLAPFQRLIGGQWHLEGSYQEFEWGVGRRSVKAKSYFVVDGSPRLVSEGTWFFHPGENQIKGVFTAVDMPVVFFDYTTRFEGDTMVSDLRSYDAEGGETVYVESWEFLDDLHFEWMLSVQTPEGLQTVMGGTYSREGG